MLQVKMQRGAFLAFHLLVFGASFGDSLSYDPADYLEVYPDPRDPAVLRGRTPLHFALVQSLGGPFSLFDGSGNIAGVQLALDRINNDTTLLPGYTLHYTFTDSKCNRTESLNALFSQIIREPKKVAVVGSGCSVATEAAAEISHYYNISQISCSSSSSALRNRVRFKNYFQLLSAEETMAFAYYGVIKEYEWRRVAFIVQDEDLFTVTLDLLKVLLDRDGVEYNERKFSTDDGISGLGDNPFDENSRIYLIAMYGVNARALLCEAHKRKIGAPRHTLLLPGWYRGILLLADDENNNCTLEERERVVVSSLAVLNTFFLDPVSDADLTTETGNITGGEFLVEERTYFNQTPLFINYNQYSQYCHDATWTLAFALSSTLKSLANMTLNMEIAEAFNLTYPFRLEDINYKSNRLQDVLFEHLESTWFDGITGQVSFGEEGIRPVTELIAFQYRNVVNASPSSMDLVEIGHIIPSGTGDYTFKYKPQEDVNTVWNGVIPYDGVPVKEVETFSLPITVIFISSAILGTIFAVVCLIFNFVYRNSKLVKLASSQLNYLIGIGAIILYLNSALFVIPSTDPDVATAICNITPWLTAIGYSLCYGTILMKMSRVYYIFNNPSDNKKGIQDWMLIMGVGFLVAIDMTIVVAYLVVEGVRGNLGARLVPFREEKQGEQDIITEKCIYLCDSTARSIFLGVLYGYKMVLQVIALVFAFSIRKVKVKGLNDAKFIAAAIYVTSIVLVVTIVGTYTLRNLINAFASLVCAGFFIGTTVILILVFVPLMMGLYKDPMGENIFTKTSGGNTMTQEKIEIDLLRSRVQELEDEKQTSALSKKAVATNSRTKTGCISSALKDCKMVTATDPKSLGTIWDAPKEPACVNGSMS